MTPSELTRATDHIVSYLQGQMTCLEWSRKSTEAKASYVAAAFSRVPWLGYIVPPPLFRDEAAQIARVLDGKCQGAAPRGETNFATYGEPVSVNRAYDAGTYPAEFFQLAGLNCHGWMNLSRAGKLDKVTQTLGARGLWQGAVFGSGGPQATWHGLTRDQIVPRIDAYCLRLTTTKRNPFRPAGDVSPTPQGSQWAGVAALAGLFGFFYWGLRQESPAERDAYAQMKARGNPFQPGKGDWRDPTRYNPFQPGTLQGGGWRESGRYNPIGDGMGVKHVVLFAAGAATGAFAMHQYMKPAYDRGANATPSELPFQPPPGLARSGDFLLNDRGVRVFRIDPITHRVFNVTATGETPVLLTIDGVAHPAVMAFA